MKSIMEKASSIIKAIQNAWIRADKPQEFSVKILERPKKNFIGFTVKSAKIALFFDEPAPQERVGFKELKKPRKPLKRVKEYKKQPPRKQEEEISKKPRQMEKPVWTNDMTQLAQEWVQETLSLLGLSKTFKSEVRRYHLKFNFDTPVIENREKEQQLFRSFAYLIMQSLRNKYKKGFKGLKVVLKSSQFEV